MGDTPADDRSGIRNDDDDRTGIGGLADEGRSGADNLAADGRAGVDNLAAGGRAGAGNLAAGGRAGVDNLAAGGRAGAGNLAAGGRAGVDRLAAGGSAGAGRLAAGGSAGAAALAAGGRGGVGRPAWLPLGAAALIVPTALAAVTLALPRPAIENELTQRAGTALSAAGIPSTGIHFDGRDATISGVPAAARDQALAAVEGATGVRVATFTDDGAAAPAAPAAPATPFGIQRQGDNIVLTGVVGTDAEKQQLVAAATAAAGGKTVVDQLTVSPGATLPAGLDAGSLGAATTAIAGAPGDVSASLTANGLTLTGAVPDDATKSSIQQAVAAAVPGATIDNQLTVSGPAAGAPAGDLDAAAKQQLQSQLTALIMGAPITFGPDSPQLTSAGSATVDRVVTLVKTAPGARLQIDGFVATGKGNGKLTAQELSDMRAATVRDALVAGGIPADHLVARGLGEGATPAQQAEGRRVEITVV